MIILGIGKNKLVLRAAKRSCGHKSSQSYIVGNSEAIIAVAPPQYAVLGIAGRMHYSESGILLSTPKTALDAKSM